MRAEAVSWSEAAEVLKQWLNIYIYICECARDMIQLNTFSGEQVLECLLRYQSKSVRQCSRLNSEWLYA
jgi:hypothetical protein